MPVLLAYCVKLSVSLTLVSLFYQLVLRKLTFYNWNRYYLIGYSFLSFFIAFIDISPVLHQNEWTNVHFVQWIPVLEGGKIVSESTKSTGAFAIWDMLGFLLLVGMVVMFFRLLVQLVSFSRLMGRAAFISTKGVKLYQVHETIIPFSFGNAIFMNRDLHSEAELKEIIQHEFIHVKQKHTIDIIWSEIVCVLNWYNPFAWLLKASIRQNLEYIADNKVLENGINKTDYQWLLLKVVGNNQFSIASKFNFSSLKKRIAMMNKLKSARLNLARFLFILPLVVALLLAFRGKELEKPFATKNDRSLPAATAFTTKQITDTVPSTKKSKESRATEETTLSTVSNSYEITEDRAVIHLKNGTTEEYDLNDKEQKKKFEEKYGKIINISAQAVPTVAVSGVNAAGVRAMVAPVTIVSNRNVNGNGNGVGAGSNYSNVTVATSINTSPAVAVTANVNSIGTGVIAPVAVSGGTVSVIADDKSSVNGDEEVLFTITKHTTRQQLDELKTQMKEKGFDLSFKEIKYSDDGNLVSVSGTMESKDVTNSFSAAAFNKLVISMISDGEHTYFRVRTTSNKVVI